MSKEIAPQEMTAVEYFKAKRKMCDSIKKCFDCPLDEINNTSDADCFDKGFEKEAVAIVQKWAAEHLVKTRQSEFLKIFPNARKYNDGIVNICPKTVDVESDQRCEKYSCFDSCVGCKKDFWLAELPEERS